VFFAVAVNYGTPELISHWAASIRQDQENAQLVVVDNFHSEASRERAQTICRDERIELVESTNVGYGQGLNIGIAKLICSKTIDDTDLVIFGNIDLQVKAPAAVTTSESRSFLPKVLQGGKDRNPFLTKLQSRFLWVYDVVAATQSPIALRIAAGIIKLLGLLPSAPYATHGSLFVLNGAALKNISHPIFNPKTFLYCEEMDFAEALRHAKIPLSPCSIEVIHIGRVSTGAITKTKREFIGVWVSGWRNWRERW
jgi:GT2 family glycosyltransferase